MAIGDPDIRRVRGTRCKVAMWAAIAIALVASACSPGLQVNVTERRGQPTDSSTLANIASFDPVRVIEVRPVLSLVGDVGFRQDDLDEAQRRWFDRLWTAAHASLGQSVARVQDDDAYVLGRTSYLFNHALLMGLRATGDLRFLDAVDDVAEAIRAQLRDEWCGRAAQHVDVNVRYGTVRSPDGYLNFRLRLGNDLHYCRDTGDLNETLVHGHLALVMYAYHVNRNNPSPAGIDYGERADFWLDYLRNHFEAKWRERSNTSWPNMDFINLKFCHTYHQMLMYHTYVGLRLASDDDTDAEAYLRQVLRLTDGMFGVPYRAGSQPGGFIPVETQLGEAVIYSFGAPGATDVSQTHLEACPVTYARYMLASVLNLHLDAIPGWDDDIMERIANGLASFVIDTHPLDARSDPFAAGVSGDRTVAMLPPTAYRGRTSVSRIAATPFSTFAAWEASGRLERTMLEVYGLVERDPNAPESVDLPAGMLMSARLKAVERTR